MSFSLVSFILRVRADTRIPGDWTAFLRVDENKEELFLYLAEQLTTIETDHGEVVSTKHETVVFNNDRTDAAGLSPCAHKEADTRLLLHAADAARRGYTKVMVRTVDTDVVVIAVAKFQYISLSEPGGVLKKFNTGRLRTEVRPLTLL